MPEKYVRICAIPVATLSADVLVTLRWREWAEYLREALKAGWRPVEVSALQLSASGLLEATTQPPVSIPEGFYSDANIRVRAEHLRQSQANQVRFFPIKLPSGPITEEELIPALEHLEWEEIDENQNYCAGVWRRFSDSTANALCCTWRSLGSVERALLADRIGGLGFDVYPKEAYDAFLKLRPKRNSRVTPTARYISSEIRLLVWERDEGRCVHCGSGQDLQFDHVIPVSKGGGSSAENLELLCGPCNRLKSNRIV